MGRTVPVYALCRHQHGTGGRRKGARDALGEAAGNGCIGCAEGSSYNFGASCVEVEGSKGYGVDISRQLAGKLLPVINILSNHPEIKNFVSFSEKPLYFHENGCIMQKNRCRGACVCRLRGSNRTSTL